MLKPARRTYNCSDADLKQTADHVAVSVTRDIADFAIYDVSAADITTFNSLVAAFLDKTTDDESLGDQKTETDNKNALRKELEELLRLIRTAAQLRYAGQGKYRKFGFDGFSRMSDNDFVRMVRRVQRVLTELNSELTGGFPFLNDKLAELTTKGEAFDLAVDKIIDKKNARDLATQERILAGNAVYVELFLSSTIGKTLYQDINEAKYNDYVLAFQGSVPGEPEVPAIAGIRGLITDITTGLPLEIGTKVMTDLTSYSVNSSAESRYEISPIPAGTYNLSFWAVNYDVYRVSNVIIPTGIIRTLDIALVPMGGIKGKITNAATGLPIEGASVTALKEGSEYPTDSWPNGMYYHNIPTGNYTLRVSKPGYLEMQMAEITVVQGQNITKNLAMVPVTP